MPFTQILPVGQLLSDEQSVVDIAPVSATIHCIFKSPENSCIPAIANTPITNNRMDRESITREKELNRVLTIIFKAFTLVIVRKGRSTRTALRALTENPKLTTRGNKLVTTITKSKMFQRSRRYAFLLKRKP